MQNKILCVFFLIFYIFSKIFKYPGKIPEICQFPKLSRKIPKIPENSRISGEVETLVSCLLHIYTVQCVPIKRKPVLSVEYLHCHARFNQTILFIIKGSFSSFMWSTKHMMISQCITEKEQFKLVHFKIDLRRIMVLSWYDQVQTS